jgi:hypothetical protein
VQICIFCVLLTDEKKRKFGFSSIFAPIKFLTIFYRVLIFGLLLFKKSYNKNYFSKSPKTLIK